MVASRVLADSPGLLWSMPPKRQKVGVAGSCPSGMAPQNGRGEMPGEKWCRSWGAASLWLGFWVFRQGGEGPWLVPHGGSLTGGSSLGSSAGGGVPQGITHLDILHMKIAYLKIDHSL